MYTGSLYSGDIIAAFERNVPDTYIRDYRAKNGYIVICRGYRDIKWANQLDAGKVERQVPYLTLMNMPQGIVTAPSLFRGLKLLRPGWRRELRRAAEHLSNAQMVRITRALGERELFPGVCV